MPRRPRQPQPPPRRAGGAPSLFGRPWPLPLSPLTTALVVLFVLAAGAAWYFEGRYETPPSEAAKLVLPYRADQAATVTLTTSDGSVTFTRDASGKLTTGGPTPTPTPTPPPEATPGPVVLSPSTKLDGLLNQLADLQIDRVISTDPNAGNGGADYGLDKPQFTLSVTPKQGQPWTIQVGGLNPDSTAYYVRRVQRKDIVLVSRYTLDDLMQVASDLVKNQGQ